MNHLPEEGINFKYFFWELFDKDKNVPNFAAT
jgi:hypothetical protein